MIAVSGTPCARNACDVPGPVAAAQVPAGQPAAGGRSAKKLVTQPGLTNTTRPSWTRSHAAAAAGSVGPLRNGKRRSDTMLIRARPAPCIRRIATPAPRSAT